MDIPGLNYHHLQYFWMTAREGSIASAARILRVTQPTISGQIRALETALGERLFDRKGRSLVLTEIGHVAYRYAEEIFALGRELQSTVAGRPTGGPLRLAVGVSDSLPKLTTFRLLRPALGGREAPRLILRVDKTERLLADLAIHALDLVLTDSPITGPVKVRAFNHLLGESAVTVFGTPDEAERYRRDFPRSLDDAPFVLPTENTALRRHLDQYFVQAGIHPRITAEVEDMAILQVLGRTGYGLFAAPSVVEEEIRAQYGVQVVGRLEGVKERFYAVSVERKLRHPAVVAISEAARRELFGP
ncbi:MAG: LysR family transcriptional regulator [Gemmatimonadales bacterium]|nr:LysR family transcriptional regulator [Gemmatimonadales bacterium]